MLSGATRDHDGGGRRSLVGGDVGIDQHSGAELVEHVLRLGLPRRCRLSLETSDGETLLCHRVGHVSGVLPDSELDHAHYQQQQQRGGDNQLGRD